MSYDCRSGGDGARGSGLWWQSLWTEDQQEAAEASWMSLLGSPVSEELSCLPSVHHGEHSNVAGQGAGWDWQGQEELRSGKACELFEAGRGALMGGVLDQRRAIPRDLRSPQSETRHRHASAL